MSFLRAWRYRLTHLGADGLPPSEAKYVVLTNAACLVALILAALFFFLLLPVASGAVLMLSLVQGPIWSLPLLLNFRRRHTAATVVLLLGAAVVFMMHSVLLGTAFGHHLFIILGGLVPWLMFPANRSRIVVVTTAVAGVLFAVCLWMEGRFVPRLEYPAFMLPAVRMVVVFGVFMAAAALGYWSRAVFLSTEKRLAVEHQKAESLLLNVLPASIAERLKQNPGTIAESFSDVTVLFADLAGFTPMSDKMSPDAVVHLLSALFERFDKLAAKHGVEKIKTIGDAYMVASGLPLRRSDHAEVMAEMALDMLATAAELTTPDGKPLSLRIGMHSGPVVAGVIGSTRFSYDVWGDTVNTASRMESHGQPGAIHVSEQTHALIASRFKCEPRGSVAIKGKGEMTTYFLRSRA